MAVRGFVGDARFLTIVRVDADSESSSFTSGASQSSGTLTTVGRIAEINTDSHRAIRRGVVVARPFTVHGSIEEVITLAVIGGCVVSGNTKTSVTRIRRTRVGVIANDQYKGGGIINAIASVDSDVGWNMFGFADSILLKIGIKSVFPNTAKLGE
jgi:hypothetical protein